MSALLVPMIVDTVVVRPGTAAESYGLTRYATPQLPARVSGQRRQPRVRQPIFPPPFQPRSAARLPGVHLHWALPDSLTRFDHETGKLPAVPSRWLVARLDFRPASGGGWTRAVTAWLQPNVHDPATTWIRGGHTQAQALGRATPSLTIRGQGDTRTFPGWAFYSDNVDGRLAFHDPLTHADDAGLRGPLAYLVAGWYTHAQLDPLRPQEGQTVWETMDDLRWSVNRALPIDPPDRVIVHGNAVGIAWPTAAAPPGVPAELDLRPAADSVNVALADTLTAATGTLAFPTATGALDAIAEALVAGELDELDEPDGLARLDGTRHQLRFRASATGRAESDVIFQSEGAPSGGQLEAEEARPLPLAAVRAEDATPHAGSFAELRASFAERRARTEPAADAALLEADQAAAADSAGLTSVETGSLVPVRHPTPRRWDAVDPVVAFAGLGRSLRHGHDGRYDPEFGTLPCRRTSETLLALHQPAKPPTWAGVTLLGASDPAPSGTWVTTVPATGQRVAAPIRLPGAVGLPAELEPLLHELATVDPATVPGYGTLLDGGADADAAAATAARIDWWTLWSDVSAWLTPPTGRFTLLGTPPCPLAVTRPTRAWVPLHVDWRVTWTPVVRGIADFPLGELDFEPPAPWPASAPGGVRTLEGRGILNDAPMRLLRRARERPQAGGLPPVPQLDAAACALDGLLARVRRTPEGFWFSPDGIDDTPVAAVLEDEQYNAVPIAAGAWRLTDFRVVDAFGRTLSLIQGGTAATTMRTAEHLEATGAPGVVHRPRFTAPLMVDARFLDPGGAVAPPRTGETVGRPVEATTGQNPLAGWFVPTPVDGSVELFNPAGRSIGRIAIDRRTFRTVWEDTPADATVPVGVVDPSERTTNPVLARLARSLIDADRARSPERRSDSTLGAFLRLVDTTLRYVDSTGGTGTGHLALLLGTPLAIVRVGLTVDVDDAQATRNGSLPGQLVPVRIGSVTRLSDGVIAFWVEDQPDRIYSIHALLAQNAPPLPGEDGGGGVENPSVVTEPVVWVQPGRMRTLTVLLAPGAQMTVTSGLAPRKALDLLPEWTDRPAALLTPTLAFDAVLRTPDTIALPIADDINGVWSWYHRPAGTTAWKAAEVPADPAATSLGDQTTRVEDGYLRVRLLPPPEVKGVEFQVTCIRRIGRAQTIQELGIRQPDGSVTRLGIDEAIRLVELGRVRFYVDVGGHRAYVVVDVAPSGRKFLRTTFDTTTVNNLANLPICTTQPPPAPRLPFGNVDAVTVAPGGVRVAGWAIDPDTTAPISVNVNVDGALARNVVANVSRPDVGAAHPGFGDLHGFDLVVPAAAGARRICVYGINVGPASPTNPELGCRDVQVPPPEPFGNVDAATPLTESIRVAGWAIDPDTATPIDVHIYVDGAFVASATANLSRPDVGAAYPGFGNLHGFELVVPAAAGLRRICVYGINTGPGGTNTQLGCRDVQVEAPLTTVPDVRELFQALATSQVRDAGLVPRLTGATGVRAWVLQQSPAGGTTVPRGSTVTLVMSTDEIP